MRILIVGAGGVGLGVGSCLLVSGLQVKFATRPGRSEELRTQGLWRSGIFGEVRFPPQSFEVVESLGENRDVFDFILVCTKAFASQQIAEELVEAFLPGRPPILIMQNGWGSAEIFAEEFGENRVFNARVITGFRRVVRNGVEITVHADDITLGSLFGVASAPLAELAQAIHQGGVPCRISEDIGKDLWAKMLYNCALNPLGALLEVPYGDLARGDGTRRIMEAVIREIYAVMQSAGFATHWSTADAYIEAFYAELVPPTASHESSMLQDLRAGRRSEIDALCGAVASLGRKVGLDTPINEALCKLVRAAEGQSD